MNKLLLLWLLLAPSFGLAQDAPTLGTPEYLTEKYGLRDATFERPLSSFPSMKYVRTTRDGVKIYTRPMDKLSLGEFKLKSIQYGFYKGLLASIYIKVIGKDNVDGVIIALETNYGYPEKKDYIYKIWRSNRVLLKATVTEDTADLDMSSVYLLGQIEHDAVSDLIKKSDRKEAAGYKAASDL